MADNQFIARKGLISLDDSQITGSLSITNAVTASVFTGSFRGDGTNLYNIPSSGVTGLNLDKIISGSVSASISPNNGFRINTDVYIDGTITAKEFHTDYVTSSVLYQSGSTKFGDTLDDLHEFTGSVRITGSITLNGQAIGTGKLDETTFNSYTSSISSSIGGLSSSITTLSSSLSGSIDSLSSSVASINNTQNGRLDSLETASGSIRTNFNTFTSSYTTGSFTGSFIGDGSQLTGIDGFPFTGSAKITGSLAVTGSLTVDGNVNATSFTGSIQGTATTASYVNLTNVDGFTSYSSSVSSSINSVLDATTPITATINNTNSPFTITNQTIAIVDSTNGNVTVNLPDLNTVVGTPNQRPIIIYKNDYSQNVVFVEPSGSQLVNGTTRDIIASIQIGIVYNPTSAGWVTEGTSYQSLAELELFFVPRTETGSLSVSTASYVEYTNVANKPSLVSGSSQISFNGITDKPTLVSGSSQIIYSGLTGIPSGIVSGSSQVAQFGYATTGSNVFVGSQVITGSLYITTDLIVQGSSSLQNITASAVSIGTNTVILNTDTPAVRFAGISVQDSGSNAGVTGSIFWDGLCNRWVYSNPSGIGYSGGMLISGPRTSTLGSEAPLTCNYIAKSGGGDHIYDSCIIDDGTTVCVNANLKVTGTACFATGVDAGTGITIGISGTNDISWGTAGGIKLSRTNVGPEYALSQRWTGTLAYIDIGSSCQWNGGITILPNGGGNVGINTLNPLVKFVVQDDTTFCNTLDNGQIRIQGNTSCTKKLFLGVDTNCATTFGYIQATETGVSTRSLILQPSGGHIGIGMNTPSSTVGKYLWLGDRTALVDDSFATSYLINNATFCSVFQRVRNGFASSITLDSNGNFNVNVSGCGAAGSTATFTTAFIVNNSGNVGIGIGSPSANGVGGSPTILNIHKAGSDAAALSLSNTSTTQDVAVGAINFASTGLSCTDKRLAEISATKANNCTNTAAGNLSFYTSANAGLSEKMRITAGGFVGINCTEPGYVLDICGGVNINTDAYTKQGTVQSLRVSSNVGNAAVTINACSLNNYSYLTFAQNCVAKFELGFSACTDSVSTSTFYMNPNTQKGACGSAVFIKSSGCVGIGRGCVEFTLDVNGDIALNRQNRLHFASSNVGDRCRSFLAGDYNNNIFVCGPSSNAIAAFMYTGTVCTYNLLNAAGGVKFGNGTGTLNYYEQGTWTPRLKNGSFTTNAGAGNCGWYTRIGNLVTVGGTLDWGAGSGAQDGNSLQIACLPFASSNTNGERNVGQPGAPAPNSIGFKCTGKGQLTLVNDPGASYIYLIETYQDGSYMTYRHDPLVGNAGTIYGFQMTYHI